ncbi:Aminopeptidase Y (Arg, Lys, Leu preference) [Pseudonocardia sp. Ae168_Ps1]|nr:Aminopeptidase Y (Arg, Lys, Leu preference) [Pseudonocardia sp. Ae168_Ps1]OLL83976.1 Aminopeptidase Y (Arg, Lys, Leu preference) [Pseudonocardia sp. Ae263_Ps1]OLL96004.1 Aminopeptidase Y (Arg, Lys, Leu preference) [Pseudonocardia sp. Ae356_Ps1]
MVVAVVVISCGGALVVIGEFLLDGRRTGDSTRAWNSSRRAGCRRPVRLVILSQTRSRRGRLRHRRRPGRLVTNRLPGPRRTPDHTQATREPDMRSHVPHHTSEGRARAVRRSRRPARCVAALLACAVMVLTACTTSTPAGPGPTPPDGALAQRVRSTPSATPATTHLEALQRIADDAGGNRASGSPGYERSVDYVAGVLRDAGFDVDTPTYYDADLGRELRNVVARTRDGDPGALVLAGAHLDSVPEGPGINDDGTGVAALLEAALRLGPAPGVATTVAFGFWGSEEEGLHGSRGYVEGLTPQQRDAHLLYLNVDMLGSSNGGYFVQGGAGDDESETGPPGSGTVAAVLGEELAATGARAEPIPLYGDDDGPFVEAGIPTGGAVTGDGDTKSAQQAAVWGGTEGEVFDPCYHSACDTLASVDTDRFDRYTTAVAATLARFAETPAGAVG